MKCVALISGGKDSCFNMMHCVAMGHEIVVLANLRPPVVPPVSGLLHDAASNDEMDSFMYQTVGHEAIESIADAMQLPLVRKEIHGRSLVQTLAYDHAQAPHGQSDGGTDEVEDLFLLLKRVKEEYPQVEAVSVGAILSDYQRTRVESVCQRLGLTSLAYLWRRSQETLLQEMLQAGLDAVLIKVAAVGLDPNKHLGKSLKQVQPHLLKMRCNLDKQSALYGLHVCGEGGEYETFTLDCPLFLRRIVIDESTSILHGRDAVSPVAYLKINRLHTEPKEGRHARNWDEDRVSLRSILPTSNVFGLDLRDADYPEVLSVLPSRALTPSETSSASAERSQPSAVATTHPTPRLSSAWGGYRYTSRIVPRLESLAEEDTLEAQVTSVFHQLKHLLAGENLSLHQLAVIHLYVSDLALFARINLIYGKFFGLSPPSRVCVQLPLAGKHLVQLDAAVCVPLLNADAHSPQGTRLAYNEISSSSSDDDGDSDVEDASQRGRSTSAAVYNLPPAVQRSVMHVQSISHWAPANIGPYSQCVSHGFFISVAGQIALTPGTMKLPAHSDTTEGLGFAREAWTALGHLHQVLQAVNGSLANVPFVICYLTDKRQAELARVLFRRFLEQVCDTTHPLSLLAFVHVPALPRAASIEWEAIGAQAALHWQVSKLNENEADRALLCSRSGTGFAAFGLLPERNGSLASSIDAFMSSWLPKLPEAVSVSRKAFITAPAAAAQNRKLAVKHLRVFYSSQAALDSETHWSDLESKHGCSVAAHPALQAWLPGSESVLDGVALAYLGL